MHLQISQNFKGNAYQAEGGSVPKSLMVCGLLSEIFNLLR